MLNARSLFNENIASAKQVGSIFDYLARTVTSLLSFDDLLRFQIVYSVSAFDKLMHDLVRIGMVEIFTGTRPATPKYGAESISLEIHTNLVAASFPPKQYIFEQALFQKFKHVSYQDPEKVADGLSYIWAEPHKWMRISEKMELLNTEARTKLKLIVDRRNAIVHEADINPVTNSKLIITKIECEETTDFLLKCGISIVDLVML